MKRCSACRRKKSGKLFYADKRRRDGLKSQCKKCHTRSSIDSRDKERHADRNRQFMRRARKVDPQKFRSRERLASRSRPWSKEREARYQLNLAVARGVVKKPGNCEECGRDDLRIEGHHKDYSKALEVEWLCSECHGKKRRRL